MPGGAILFTTKVIATTCNFSVQVPVSPVSFAVAVVVPHVVSRVLSLCRVGVAVAVVAPHSVLRLLSSRRAWGRSRGHMPRVVLRSRSLRHVGVAGAGVAPRVVLRLLSLRCVASRALLSGCVVLW
jgi:hypothetical protein